MPRRIVERLSHILQRTLLRGYAHLCNGVGKLPRVLDHVTDLVVADRLIRPLVAEPGLDFTRDLRRNRSSCTRYGGRYTY